jgi:hypothetical protein
MNTLEREVHSIHRAITDHAHLFVVLIVGSIIGRWDGVVPGGHLSRSAVIRAALARGLAAIQADPK